jgi:hypothetical protein
VISQTGIIDEGDVHLREGTGTRNKELGSPHGAEWGSDFEPLGSRGIACVALGVGARKQEFLWRAWGAGRG